MAGEATRGVGDWRAGRGQSRSPVSPTRASAQKWSTATVLAALLIAAVLVVGWIVWQWIWPNTPNPQFIAFWVGEFQRRSGTDRADVERSRLSASIPPIPW